MLKSPKSGAVGCYRRRSGPYLWNIGPVRCGPMFHRCGGRRGPRVVRPGVGVPFSALTPLPDATIRSLDPPELRDLPSDGSFLFTSGATALKPAPGMLAVAATNAAVHAITAGLAVELAPIRVNAIAPGTIDTGAYDALGDERKAAVQSPVRGQSQAGPAPFLAYLAARRGGTSARLFRWRESGW